MQIRHLLLFSVLWLFLPTPAMAQTSNHETGQTQNYPSEELLEFLAEFGDLDEETFKLIEYHALQDSASPELEKANEN